MPPGVRSRFGDVEAAARAFIRVERQTLRKLPVTGDILFTIRIHLDPMAALREPSGADGAGRNASPVSCWRSTRRSSTTRA